MNMDITIKDFELKFSKCNPNILFEGIVSQNFDLVFIYDKKRVTFGYFFSPKNSTFHEIKN